MKVLEAIAWEYMFFCEGCHSRLQAEKDDVHYRVLVSFDDTEHQFGVICTVCTQWHTIPWKYLRDDVRKEASTKRKVGG